MRQWTCRGLALSCLILAGCNGDRLTVPNFANPTPDALAEEPTSDVQFRANGILDRSRRNATSWINASGMFGRESFNYFLSDSRVTTQYLDGPVLDPGSGAAGGWNGPYTTLRTIFDFLAVIDSVPETVFGTEQKAAARGFAHTMEALELSYLISSRDSLGIPVEISADPRVITPFVSRDSAYNYIIGRLELAKTELQAGGAAFPFELHSGYSGLNTPASFLMFNRALTARINAYRASLGIEGCGGPLSSTCYQTVLDNLAESFLDTGGPLDAGAYWVYSISANDVTNSLSQQLTANYVAHPSIGPDAPLRADGSFDLRYQTKIRRLPTPRGFPTPGLSIPTDYAFDLYPTASSPIPIIKNEGLILLRAEARYFTGDHAGALADINTIRVNSGGLEPIAGFASQDAFITELLLQRRYSLLWEGHRWVDTRRFDRLDTLPIDIPERQFVTTRQPVPTSECLSRAESEYPGPGC